MEIASISRVSNLSNLDSTSPIIHVYSAIRPAATSLAVSMGKSYDKDEAKCGAIIESIETYFAEQVCADLTKSKASDMVSKKMEVVFCPNQLCIFAPNYPVDWVKGYKLDNHKSIYFPHSVVSLDSNLLVNQLVGANSNGLASGNNYKEALVISLFEQIERISIRSGKWKRFEPNWDLREKYKIKSDYSIRLFICENEFLTPIVRAEIYKDNHYGNQCIYAGTSASYSYRAACMRAIEEAIQSKVGVISGARDDLVLDYYSRGNTAKKYCESPVTTPLYRDFEGNNYPDVLAELKVMLKMKGFEIGVFEYYKGVLTTLKAFILDSENNIL